MKVGRMVGTEQQWDGESVHVPPGTLTALETLQHLGFTIRKGDAT